MTFDEDERQVRYQQLLAGDYIDYLPEDASLWMRVAARLEQFWFDVKLSAVMVVAIVAVLLFVACESIFWWRRYPDAE